MTLPAFEFSLFNLYVQLIIVALLGVYEFKKIKRSKLAHSKIIRIEPNEFETVVKSPGRYNAIIVDASPGLLEQVDFSYEHIKGSVRYTPEMINPNSPKMFVGDKDVYIYARSNKSLEKTAAAFINQNSNRKIYALNGGLQKFTGKKAGLLPDEILK
jgi:hypothetical protein